MKTEYIVFTDLDGTLLDYHSYSFEPAMPALKLLCKHQIPLILVSSKTRAEMQDYQIALGIEEYPFVVENGSAIFTQPEYFPKFSPYKIIDSLWGYYLGRSYKELVQILADISNRYGYRIEGFHNCSDAHIIKHTGLNPHQVKMAKEREFSIPIFYDQQTEDILRKEISRYNLRLLFGGRFMHLLGNVDKGKALNTIMNEYRSTYPSRKFASVALGDSLNDFAMLSAADIPILVKRHDGSYEDREKLPDVLFSPAVGPSGWNISVLEVIKKRGIYE